MATAAKLKEKAPDGYAEAVKFAIETAKGVWEIFRNMLAANSFIVVLIGAIKHSFPVLWFLSYALAVLGLGICLAWFLLTRRMADYNHYFYAVTRQLESSAFEGTIRTVRDGAMFANGSEVTVDGKPYQMRWASKLFKVETLINSVIVSFGVIYLSLLIFR